MRQQAERKGFALAIAIVAIVIIGVLVAGAFFTSMQDMRVGANSMVQQRAFAIAEAGLNTAVAGFDTLDLDTLGNGRTRIDGPVSVGQGRNAGSYRLWATRLNDRTYWLVSEGTADAAFPTATSRMTNIVLRLRGFRLATSAAITGRVTMDIGDRVDVSGTGPPPSGWTECSAYVDPGMPGIIAPAGVVVAEDVGSDVTGNPSGVARNAIAADSATYTNFGDLDLASLIAGADRPSVSGILSPMPSSTGSVCDRSAALNWGDRNRSSPAGPCESFFPVVYAPGNLDLRNGRGQGILIVAGDLVLSGNFDYAGVVIIGGELRTVNDGNDIWGTVLARGLGGRSAYLRGNMELRYSLCTIREAVRAVARATPVTQRAWADLF